MAIGWRVTGVLAVVLTSALTGCASIDPGVPGESPTDSSENASGDPSTDAPAGEPADGGPVPVRGSVLVHAQAPPTPAAGPNGGAEGASAASEGPAAGPKPTPPGLWDRMRTRFALPEPPPERIESELQRYSGRQGYFDIVLGRGEPYIRYILGRLEARELPAELLLVPLVESTFRPFAYSHSRAGGIWQFTPATGRHYGLAQNWWYDGRRDVVASTEAALDYLEYLHGLFDGDWLLAMAAYNAGEGRVRRAVRRNAARDRATDFWHLDLPRQTEHYVPRILALRAILADPAAHGVDLPELEEDSTLTVVKLPGQVDLALAAEMAGIAVDELYRYNPGFNRWATPPEGPHRLALPEAHADDFRAALAQHDPDDMVRWRRHRVASGETLSGIAADYGTSVAVLQDLNDLDGALIRAGDHLLVPTASRPAGAYALSAPNRRQARQAQGPEGRQRVEHVVRSGDTLWEVARRHDVGVRRLATWNGMAPGDVLHPGDRLVVWVDSAGVGGPNRAGPRQRLQRVRYTVRSGDSLYEIAREFGLTVAEIERWNELDRDDYLQPGQQLELHVDVTEQAEAG